MPARHPSETRRDELLRSAGATVPCLSPHPRTEPDVKPAVGVTRLPHEVPTSIAPEYLADGRTPFRFGWQRLSEPGIVRLETRWGLLAGREQVADVFEAIQPGDVEQIAPRAFINRVSATSRTRG